MNSLKWRDEYAIDVPIIDRQHRELFARVNTFLEACAHNKQAGEIVGLFLYLESYSVVHFTTEEMISRDAHFPDLDEHLKMHTGFIDTLRFLRERFEKSGLSPELLREMQSFVSSWLVQHVTLEDKALGQHLKDQEAKRKQPTVETTDPIQDKIRPL